MAGLDVPEKRFWERSSSQTNPTESLAGTERTGKKLGCLSHASSSTGIVPIPSSLRHQHWLQIEKNNFFGM